MIYMTAMEKLRKPEKFVGPNPYAQNVHGGGQLRCEPTVFLCVV